MVDKKVKAPEQKKALKRCFEGEVVTVGKNKTIQVSVTSIKVHAKYRKQYSTRKKYAVHDEKNEAKPGEKVMFEECRPISKTKRWRLIKIIK